MHEVSLCESIVDTIREHAERDGFSRVHRIRLEIGRLSCAEPEALHFAFDAVAKGTPAEAAELLIERTPGLAWCAACRNMVGITQRYDACPDCGHAPLDVRGGDAMKIIDLEVV